MTKEDLIKMLGDHEDNFLERKSEGVNDRALRQTAVAFANSVPAGRVAVVFIGVNDKTGRIDGVSNPDALQKRVREALEGDCYPPIRHQSEVLSVEQNAVVAVVIPPSADKPHFAGPAYVRVGSQSRNASEQQYRELIDSRVEKCGALLALKNQIVTVHGVGYKLGTHKPLADRAYRAYREGMECRVMDCNAQYVTLMNIASNPHFSEPLAGVDILYDHEKWRPLLSITYPR